MLLIAFAFAVCISSSLQSAPAAGNGYCDGTTINCRSHEELAQLINDLKAENRRIRLATDPNCTVCWSNPCLNGGTCEPLGLEGSSSYLCNCLDNFGGRLCETEVTCKPNSCGKHASCFVKNHQTNCVCDLGYSGNPKRGCTMKSVEACMDGDPHYATFDGQRYEYQGTCPYIFSEPCNATAIRPFQPFSVKAKNELTYDNAHVSTVREVEVTMYGQAIHVDKKLNLYVNGIKMKMPFYYPSKLNSKITVKKHFSKVTIENDQFITVKFGNGELCVKVPDDELLSGPNTLCGLAGNRDNNCKNDFRYKNGEVDMVTSCKNRYQAFTENFGDSWITKDFLPLNSDTEACLTGVEVSNQSLNCDLIEVKKKCEPIRQAMEGQGIFAGCADLGNTTIENAYENCYYDTCVNENLFCDSMNSFAKICQLSIPNTPLTWRKSVGCPSLSCPIHSNESPCASGCPQTCADPEISAECTEGCMEGCECDQGYVLDYDESNNQKCIKIEECGCTDSNGNSHEPNEVWLTKDCSEYNYCSNGSYHYAYKPCSSNAYCGIENYKAKCICKEGFTGDGYNCTDINECMDPTKCNANKNHGTCTNTQGSYICNCFNFYGGEDCKDYLPTRHCMDLNKFHNKTTDGVYTIKPPYPFNGKPAYSDLLVYCDMTTEHNGWKGGWTMMANSLRDSMANKSYSDYVNGFGNPYSKDLWLGLEIIHGMTTDVKTSLRLNLHRCAHSGLPEAYTDCTYPEFSVLDAKRKYAVVIPQICKGTEQQYYDGWARWDLTKTGPIFLAYDDDNSTAHCTSTFLNTGFWFDTSKRCGSANLNGIRYTCDNTPDESVIDHYLFWSGNPLSGAELYLRPADPENYDNSDKAY